MKGCPGSQRAKPRPPRLLARWPRGAQSRSAAYRFRARAFSFWATHENPVISTGGSTSLSVSEGGDPGIQAEPVDEDVLDVFTLDRVEVLVESALGDDDDRLSLSDLTVLRRVGNVVRS